MPGGRNEYRQSRAVETREEPLQEPPVKKAISDILFEIAF